jgi:hypothetical protein
MWSDRSQPKSRRIRMRQQRRSLRRVRDADVTDRWSDSDAGVPPGGVVNQVTERLRYGGGGVPFEPGLHVRSGPALVEGATQCCGTESVDPGTAARLLISQQPQLGRDRMLKRT